MKNTSFTTSLLCLVAALLLSSCGNRQLRSLGTNSFSVPTGGQSFEPPAEETDIQVPATPLPAITDQSTVDQGQLELYFRTLLQNEAQRAPAVQNLSTVIARNAQASDQLLARLEALGASMQRLGEDVRKLQAEALR